MSSDDYNKLPQKSIGDHLHGFAKATASTLPAGSFLAELIDQCIIHPIRRDLLSGWNQSLKEWNILKKIKIISIFAI